jgi:formate hydrogenlyase subunit 3/multisubunit Na+/H+ antiporter MnhD subunit
MRGRSTATRLLLLGAVCLIVVVLTHVSEALQVFAFMGWGQPDSAGHYVDFASAIVGCTLLVAGLVVAVLDHRKNVRQKR